MKIEAICRPEFFVPFTRDIVEALSLCSKLHYDQVCKDQRFSGPLFRSFNMMNAMEIDSYNISMTFRELDTLLKVCEILPTALSPEQRRLLLDFSRVGREALRKANEICRDWKFEVE